MVEEVLLEETRLLKVLYALAGCPDEAFAAEMLTAFLESSTASLRVLCVSIAGAHAPAVARAAHHLKSSFAALRMEEGAAACASLERAAQAEDVEAMQETLGKVKRLHAREAARAARLLGSLQQGVCKAG